MIFRWLGYYPLIVGLGWVFWPTATYSAENRVLDGLACSGPAGCYPGKN